MEKDNKYEPEVCFFLAPLLSCSRFTSPLLHCFFAPAFSLHSYLASLPRSCSRITPSLLHCSRITPSLSWNLEHNHVILLEYNVQYCFDLHDTSKAITKMVNIKMVSEWLLKPDPGRQRGSPSSAGQHQLNSLMAVRDILADHRLVV